MKELVFILFSIALAANLTAQENSEATKEMLEMGVDLFKQGLYDEASIHFESAISQDPENHETYMIWASLECSEGINKKDSSLLSSGIEKLKKIIELQPDFLDAHVFLGISYNNLVQIKEDDATYLECIRFLEKSIESHPQVEMRQILLAGTLLSYSGIKNDSAYAKRCTELLERSFGDSTNDTNALVLKSMAYIKWAKLDNDYVTNRPQIEKYLKQLDKQGMDQAAYILASFYSLAGEKDLAFIWLEKILIKKHTEGGASEDELTELTREAIEENEDFENIRSDKRYMEILDKYMGY